MTVYKTKLFNSKNINGIVPMESVCEMSAIPAASVVSLPYPLGTTIVLSPKGIVSDARAQVRKVSLMMSDLGINANIKMKTEGITKRRIAESR